MNDVRPRTSVTEVCMAGKSSRQAPRKDACEKEEDENDADKENSLIAIATLKEIIGKYEMLSKI